MNEKTLLRISLFSAFLGVTILLFMSKNIEPGEKDLSLAYGSDFDTKTLVSGKLLNIIEYNNSVNLVITRTEFVNIVLFEKKNLDFLGLREGDSIEAVGTIEENGKKKQLLADEVRVI